MKKTIFLVITICLTLLFGCVSVPHDGENEETIPPVSDDGTVCDTEIKTEEINGDDRRALNDYMINAKYDLTGGKAIYLCVKKSGSRQLHLMSVSDDGVAYELEDNSGKTFDIDTDGTAELIKGSITAEGYEMYFFIEETLECYRLKAEQSENSIMLTECVSISQKQMLDLELFANLEQHTVISFDKLEKYKDIIGKEPYNFYLEFFGSPLGYSEFDNMEISDVSVRFTTPVCDNTSYLSFTVEGSESITVPDGKYEWEIHGGDELFIAERTEQLDKLRSDKIYDSEEVRKLLAFLCASGQYNTPTFGKSEKYPGIKEYICSYYGENCTISFDEYCSIAKREFGVTDFAGVEPDKDGTLSAVKEMIREPAIVVTDVTSTGDTITVYLQLYSDRNCFNRSYSIAYTFSQDGKWLGYEIISMTQRKPYGLSSNYGVTTKKYKILLERDIYSPEGKVEDRDHIWVSAEIPEYIERYSDSDDEFHFFGYSKKDDKYYRVIGDETLLLICENYGIDYYYNEKNSDGKNKIKGTTASGYEYVMIETEYDRPGINAPHFSADVYIKLNDKYILYLNMSDAVSNRDSIIEIINSIKVIK